MSGPETLKGSQETYDDKSGVWDEVIDDVGDFNPIAAEVNRAKDAEKMETISTDQYEKEIRAFGDQFEEPDFLSETIEVPSDMELVKEWVDKKRHTEEIQEWVQSASNSPEEQAYKKSLAGAGFRKKLFYRSNPDLLKTFDKAREEYKNDVIKSKTDNFLNRQDAIERDVRSKLEQYDTEPDNPVSKMEGDNLPLPSRFELVKSWIEGDSVEDVKEHADLIKEWLANDDGDDKEKRYRALTRVRLGGPMLRWGRRGAFDKLEKSAVVDGTAIPYNLAWSGFYKDKLMSPKYSSLSDEDKKKKWEEAGSQYIDKIKEDRKKEIDKKEAVKAHGESLKKEGNAHDERKPIETSSLPNQGPNPMSPLFNEYPMDPSGTMFN